MDPDFAEAFNSEYPEAYGEAIRDKRRGGMKSDAALAVHVPVIPAFISRFTAGLLVMLFLIGAFFVIAQSSQARGMGIPSGSQAFNSSSGGASGFNLFGSVVEGIGSVADPKSDLGQKISPIGEAGSDFLRTVTR